MRISDWSSDVCSSDLVKDILVEAEVVLRTGERRMLALTDLDYSYRHSGLPEGAVVIGATFRGRPGEPQAIQAEMDRISASREASQQLRSKTGGIGRASCRERVCQSV